MSLVLVIHDRSEICQQLCPVIESAGHQCLALPSCGHALNALKTSSCDIVVIDIDITANADLCVDALTSLNCRPEVLVITKGENQECLERIIRAGAWDILFTPFTDEEMSQSIERCLFHRQAKQTHMGNGTVKRSAILGSSHHLEHCLESLATAAASSSSVLILGETGTGKELFARAVHENSPRANRNFIVVDCTNLPKTLAESLLFGHERGAFTGAAESHDGLFKQADGGTIFLDEIGDLDLDVQKSLLRVLQERKFRPLSSKREVASDFRLVAATNRNLETMILEGTFRRELYHRLSMRVIKLPPLRERKEDIPVIAAHHLQEICTEMECPQKEISRELYQSMVLYDWPGNVRELINTLHATIHNGIAERRLYPQHLPAEIRAKVLPKRTGNPTEGGYLVKSRPVAKGSSDNHKKPANHGRVSSSQSDDLRPMMFTRCRPAAQGGRWNFSRAGDASLSTQFESSYVAIDDGIPPLRIVREMVMRQAEAAYLHQLVAISQGDFHLALSLSGLSRARLYGLLSKHAMNIKDVAG